MTVTIAFVLTLTVTPDTQQSFGDAMSRPLAKPRQLDAVLHDD